MSEHSSPAQLVSGHHIQHYLNKLDALRDFSGSDEDFWNTFLQYLAEICVAQAAFFLYRPQGENEWRNLHTWSHSGSEHQDSSSRLKQRIAKIADRSLDHTCTLESRSFVAGQKDKRLLSALHLHLENIQGSCVIVLAFSPQANFNQEHILIALRLVTNLPLLRQAKEKLTQAMQNQIYFAQALELMSTLNQKTRYLAACMDVCNLLAAEYACSRVSLGWQTKQYIRLQSMSHIERFEKKMDAVQSLEAAMEETADQDQEIHFPPDQDFIAVTKAHETFSRKFGGEYLLSVPLRLDKQVVGVLTCERSPRPFSENEISGLALVCDQIVRRLQDLKTQDVWFGQKLIRYLRDKTASLVGVEHTFAKVGALFISALLGVLIFGHWTYRVEAPFTLKARTLAYITAPFEGYVQEVFVETGDHVRRDSTLLALNADEMMLQEAQSLAGVQRYIREAEKARAENQLADMQIAEARATQARAKLEQIRYNIEHAQVKAPFSGIVVEGEKKELLGRPVHKGDVVFKVAKLKGLYAKIRVNERDIHEVAEQAPGEIAFAGRPDLKFPVRISSINPMAQTQEESNAFITKAEFLEPPGGWWRPGMSGVAKIDAGDRSLLWIITHRTIDFIRMLFWW